MNLRNKQKEFNLSSKIKAYKNDRIIAISFGHFSHDIFSGFLAPLIPILIKQFQLTYALAGMLTVFLRLPALFNPIIGLIADRVNLKYLVIASPLITAITMSLLGFASKYTFLVLLLLIAGFSSSFFHVPAPVFIKKMAKKKSGQGMSFFMIGGELARTFSPIILMTAIYCWGPQQIYRLIPLGFLASLFLYFKLRKIKIRRKNIKIESKSILLKNSLKLLPLFLGILGVLLAKALTASMLTAYLPVYLNQKGVSLFLSGSSLSIIAIAAFIGVSISGPLSDKIGKRKVLLITQILTPVIMLIFLHVQGWLLTPLLFLLGLLACSTSPVVMALVQDKGTAAPALFNGIYMSLNFFVSSLIILVMGKCSDFLGIAFSFHLTAILAFCLLPLLFLIKE